MRSVLAKVSLLLAVACSSGAPPLDDFPFPDSFVPDGPRIDAFVEHGPVDCAARARQTRCLDVEHWRYRIEGRVLRGDELRATLRELARRSPLLDDESRFLSAATLTLRPDPDAAYSSVQRLIQNAASEGILRIDFVPSPEPAPAPRAPSERTGAPVPTELRVALSWDSQRLCTVAAIANRTMRDPAELQQAIDAAFAAAGDRRSLTIVVDAAPLVAWRDVAAVVAMAPGAAVELATGERFE